MGSVRGFIFAFGQLIFSDCGSGSERCEGSGAAEEACGSQGNTVGGGQPERLFPKEGLAWWGG